MALKTNLLKEDLLGSVDSQQWRGSASPCGHSISSHSSWRARLPFAARTRTRAKRDESLPLVPSRQLTVRQLCGATARATFNTDTGLWRASRLTRLRGGSPFAAPVGAG